MVMTSERGSNSSAQHPFSSAADFTYRRRSSAQRSVIWRFRLIKVLAAATIGVAAFVSVATSQKAWELTGVAVAPAAITVSPDAKLPEAVKQVELRSAERAFDRDTTSSYTAFGTSTVSVKLAEPRTITALRFFDKAPYRVSVRALVGGSFQPVAGLESLDLSKLEARWNTLALATPVITQELRLTIEPQSTGGAGLAEIELWADGRHANLPAGASLASAEPAGIGQAMVLSSAKPQSADGAIIGGENDDVADNRFEFSVPVLPSGLARAYLAYEGRAASDAVAARAAGPSSSMRLVRVSGPRELAMRI